jgi:hypothetical protein
LQRQILSLDAKPATHPVAVLDDLYLNFLRKIGRHGKTDKPMPCEPPDCDRVAVLMPTSSPKTLISASPELP